MVAAAPLVNMRMPNPAIFRPTCARNRPPPGSAASNVVRNVKHAITPTDSASADNGFPQQRAGFCAGQHTVRRWSKHSQKVKHRYKATHVNILIVPGQYKVRCLANSFPPFFCLICPTFNLVVLLYPPAWFYALFFALCALCLIQPIDFKIISTLVEFRPPKPDPTSLPFPTACVL